MNKNLTINTLLPIETSKNTALLKKSIDNTTYIGIDFGTSTTVVSLATLDSKFKGVISNPIELNQKLHDGSIYNAYKIPTMVAWYNNGILVGEGANRIKLKLKQGKNLWHSFKMELGEDMGYMYPQSELNSDRLKILNPKDVTTIFFKYLKVQIEKYVKDHNLPANIEYAISIPASFEANQRKDLISSLNENGMLIEKQALIDEPNAAFLSYISHPQMKQEIFISEEYPTNVLVFDFGAGTCDISILEIGYNSGGFYSKNLSISKFEALGGKDIDKLIAIDILLPQFLRENGVEESFFKTKEINQHIIPRLEKIAETLKIKISEQIALLESNNDIGQLIDDDSGVELNHRMEIRSRKGNFSLNNPKISYREFFEINDTFINSDIDDVVNRINNEAEFKSIYLPIETALKKAHLDKIDIDYLLFIGGSSKNPLIQHSLKEYFNESSHLVPRDLQAHVSSGAAIHSLIFNGFDRNIIEPITSEPIIVITKDGEDEVIKVILKAGTIIPSETVVVRDLSPQSEGQQSIEIPICVGNKNKILHNLKVKSPASKGFSINANIELKIGINADKLLAVSASIDGKNIDVEPLNPFSNEEVSLRDREKFDAEKVFNKECVLNGGEVTLSSLRKLYNEYNALGLELKAAETLEEMYEKFGSGNLNNIGLHYSNAGDDKKAMFFYGKAMDEDPSATAALNIAIQYRHADREQYKVWLRKSLDIDPNKNISLYLYGVVLVDEGDEEKGYKMINKAFENWKVEYENGYLSSHISWFGACARYLGEYELAMKLEQNDESDSGNDDVYSSENLTSVKRNLLEGK